MHRGGILVIIFVQILFFKANSQKTISNLSIDSLSPSEIDIPILINLKPIFSVAERNVDTVFTSPNYPDGWVQADCATRYKYRFRRSPLKIIMSGTSMDLSFTGFYQITGSTRACVNGTVLSPWSPACRCGFSEPERRVVIGFTSTMNLLPNYTLKTKITRKEPKALDKCEVCFWGQDVTSSVIDGLRSELEISKKAMEDSFSTINIRPYVQQAWNILSQTHSIPNVGYFSLYPKKLRMENINATNNMLAINIGISATPVISFTKPDNQNSIVPDLTKSNNKPGFNIFLEAALQYDSLSTVLNTLLVNKRFDLSEGIFKKHIIIKKTRVSGQQNGNLLFQLDFTGSFDGTVFLTGKPVYNPDTKSIEVDELDYDLQTKNVLLKTAKWLFNKRIRNELKKYTSFSLADYYNTAGKTINSWLNKEWTKGIKGMGYVRDLKLVALSALPDHLLIRSNCAGDLSVLVSSVNLSFQR